MLASSLLLLLLLHHTYSGGCPHFITVTHSTNQTPWQLPSAPFIVLHSRHEVYSVPLYFTPSFLSRDSNISVSSSRIPSSSFSESDDKHTTSVSGFPRKTWPLEIRKQQQSELEMDRTKFQKKKVKYEPASKGGTFPFRSPYISMVR